MENEEPAVMAPFIGLLFFLRSSRGQGIFSPVQVLPGINKEASW